MPRYDPTPGPAPVIGDLVAREQRLEVWCCKCRHEVQMPPAEAVRLLGAKTTFPAAARKLSCGVCGARGRDGMVRCRGSVEDFYSRLARETGMPMPTHRDSHRS